MHERLSGISSQQSAPFARGRCSLRLGSASRELWEYEELAQLESGDDRPAAEIGKVVLVAAPDTFDEPVDAHALDVARDLARTQSRELLLEVGMTKSGDEMLTSNHGQHDIEVLCVEEVEAAVISATILLRGCNLVERSGPARWVVDRADEGQIPAVGSEEETAKVT